MNKPPSRTLLERCTKAFACYCDRITRILIFFMLCDRTYHNLYSSNRILAITTYIHPIECWRPPLQIWGKDTGVSSLFPLSLFPRASILLVGFGSCSRSWILKGDSQRLTNYSPISKQYSCILWDCFDNRIDDTRTVISRKAAPEHKIKHVYKCVKRQWNGISLRLKWIQTPPQSQLYGMITLLKYSILCRRMSHQETSHAMKDGTRSASHPHLMLILCWGKLLKTDQAF